ncbi:MAG: FkbM family methyltransferase [Dehalococcoidia bacterium]|nr:FkbM family methyltransferase [Dehalococcoidia bacterium]MDW8119889.1 FkbM family methyltransferase [Chloroflexota bacterium]
MLRWRFIRYMQQSKRLVYYCATPRDKMLMVIARASHIPLHFLRRFFGYYGVGRLLPDYLLLSNICLRTPHGQFICRRFTNDFVCVVPEHEPYLQRYFGIEEGIFIDVGAHIGGYTVQVARKLGQRGRVLAIEPDPSTFQVLRKNVILNGLKNVECINVACSDQEGEQQFFRSPFQPGFNSFIAPLGGKPIVVKTTPLDALVELYRATDVRLIKIDTEGAEVHVLRGSSHVLTQASPRLIIEVMPHNRRMVHDLLNSTGYRVEPISGSYWFAHKP